jgi:hypothetical protein
MQFLINQQWVVAKGEGFRTVKRNVGRTGRPADDIFLLAIYAYRRKGAFFVIRRSAAVEYQV